MSLEVTVDSSLFRRKNGSFKRSFAKNFELWMNLGREWHAYNAFLVTLPFSRNGYLWNITRLQDRIRRDVETAYPESDPPALSDSWARRVYLLIKKVHGETIAKRWWGSQWMPDKHGRGESFDPESGQITYRIDAAEAAKKLLAGRLNANPAEYSANRKKNPLVYPADLPVSLLTSTKVKAQQAKRAKRAGLAKAGWRHAVKYSGVRAVRSSQVNIKWPRETRIPVTAVGKTPGTSSINIASQAGTGNWVISNHVPHIDVGPVFPDHAFRAHQNTQRKLQFYFNSRMKALAKLTYNAKQAAAAAKPAA